jgi:hypothetical protein
MPARGRSAEHLDGRLAPDALILADHAPISVLANHDWRYLAIEAALGLRRRGQLLGPGGELIGLSAADAPLPRDHLRGEPLVDQVVVLEQLGRERRARSLDDIGAHGHPAHALHSGGHHQVAHAGLNEVGREMDRLL